LVESWEKDRKDDHLSVAGLCDGKGGAVVLTPLPNLDLRILEDKVDLPYYLLLKSKSKCMERKIVNQNPKLIPNRHLPFLYKQKELSFATSNTGSSTII
jgi:hypothetical protein